MQSLNENLSFQVMIIKVFEIKLKFENAKFSSYTRLLRSYITTMFRTIYWSGGSRTFDIVIGKNTTFFF